MKNLKLKLGAASIALLGSAAAHADSPAVAAMQSIYAEASALIAEAWPIAVLVTVAFVGMKVFKKSASRAT